MSINWSSIGLKVDMGLTFKEAKDKCLLYSSQLEDPDFYKEERDNLKQEYYINEDGCTFEYQDLGKVSYYQLNNILKKYHRRNQEEQSIFAQILCMQEFNPENSTLKKFQRFLESMTFIENKEEPTGVDNKYYLLDNNCQQLSLRIVLEMGVKETVFFRMTPHDLDFLSGGDGYLIDPKFISHEEGKLIVKDEYCDYSQVLDEVTDIRLN